MTPVPDLGVALPAMAAITLLAYTVKAATGFGPALVVVSLGSLFIGPAGAVVLAAFLDLASGAGVAWLDRERIRREAWWQRATLMSAGAVAGSLLLGVLPTATLATVVAVGVLGFGAWMLVSPLLETARATDAVDAPVREAAPPVPGSRRVEWIVVLGAGVSGGLIGIGGPPLIVYYGPRLPRVRFRATIVPILLAAAVVRTATYTATAQVTPTLLLLAGASLPALPLGLALGNRLFHRWSDRTFRLVIAVLVTAAGIRLLLR